MKRRDILGALAGAVVAFPLAVRAQAMPVVGYLSSSVPEKAGERLKAFRDGLGEARRPGGNVTGVTNFNLELSQKRLELFHGVIPGAKRVALLVNPMTPIAVPMIKDMEAVVRLKGLELKVLNSTSAKEIEAAFVALAEWRADALVVGADAYFAGMSEQIAALAVRQSLAVIGSFPDLPRAGGLMSYCGSAGEQWRLLGVYVGKIVSSVRPADLPVQQSTMLELVLNMRTAKALGLTVPVSLLSSTGEVIE